MPELSPGSALQAQDYFVRFTLGDGSTLTADGNQLFALTDFSFGDQQVTSIGSATGSAGAGKVTFDPLKLSFDQPALDPVLFKMLAAGTHFKEVDVLGYTGGDTSHLAVGQSSA